MTPTINPLAEHLGAEITGVDLAAEPACEAVAALRDAFHRHKVICLRDQALTPTQYTRAARHFGEPALQLVRRLRHPEDAHVMILTSAETDEIGDGKRLIVGRHWHTDDSFMATPCATTMLYAIKLPSTGGDTQFTDMAAAYDDLSDATKARIAGLRCIHNYDSRRKGTRIRKRTDEEAADTPGAVHPLVRTHPVTGRKALYINPNRVDAIEGMDLAESDALLDELIAHATRPRYQYRHRWRPGDLVMWDNRCTMHKANDDYPEHEVRTMHRIMLKGEKPV